MAWGSGTSFLALALSIRLLPSTSLISPLNPLVQQIQAQAHHESIAMTTTRRRARPASWGSYNYDYPNGSCSRRHVTPTTVGWYGQALRSSSSISINSSNNFEGSSTSVTTNSSSNTNSNSNGNNNGNRNRRSSNSSNSSSDSSGNSNGNGNSSPSPAASLPPPLRHDQLPDETMYILDGTSMLFRAFYGRGAGG